MRISDGDLARLPHETVQSQRPFLVRISYHTPQFRIRVFKNFDIIYNILYLYYYLYYYLYIIFRNTTENVDRKNLVKPVIGYGGRGF